MKTPQEALETLLKIIQQSKDNQGDQKDNKISPELLPVYYLIGECYIKLNKVQKAKDFLIAAYWNTLKTNDSNANKENQEPPEESEKIQIMRHRSFSTLFLVEEKYDKAIDEIISAIILSSKLYGPESYEVTEFQVLLGNLHFLHSKDSNKKAALMCYESYVNYWFDHLMEIIGEQKMTIESFLQIKDYYFISVEKNLLELQKKLGEFEND